MKNSSLMHGIFEIFWSVIILLSCGLLIEVSPTNAIKGERNNWYQKSGQKFQNRACAFSDLLGAGVLRHKV